MKYYNIKEKNAFYKIFDQEDTMTDNTIEKYSSVKQILLQQLLVGLNLFRIML